MRKTLLLFSLLIFSLSVMGQQADQQSIAYPPPFLQVSPNGTHSEVVITNGFDNIFLGTDFGEPYIATNPRDPRNSVCAFNINNLYYTLDGYNWVKNNPAFSGMPVIGDPVMGFDSLGNCYYAQLSSNQAQTIFAVKVIKSTDKGVTWINSTTVYETTVGLCDKEWIAADQTAGPFSNHVYVCWRQFGSTGMRFSTSTDFGTTWSSPHVFSGGQGAYVCVGPNGNVQGGSVYFGAISGGVILVNRSTDGGATFSAQVTATAYAGPGVPCAGRNTVKNCIRTDPFPRMAADNSFTSTRGNVYVAFASNPPGPDNCDIYVVRSTDFGVTWGPMVRVNDDATTTDQWMPTISVDNRTGKVFVGWYDSRVDVSGNLLTRLYGATSTNGGVSFTTNANISDVSHNPDNMAVGQPGGERYMGDYIGISAVGNTGYAVWMDGRNNSLGSYVAYYPDFAVTVNPAERNLVNNDTATIAVTVPALKGPFSEAMKFTAALDSLPQSGSIQLTFVNGRDSINSVPDSVLLRVRTIGTVTPRLYKLNITGKGNTSGAPIHIRTVNLLVNVSRLIVGTNRNGLCDFKVNNTQYNSTQNLIFTNASTVTVQALSPKIIGFSRYVYTHWSDNGDTTHNVTINANTTLTAFYKVQYKLQINASPGTSFGGNDFFDSASTRTFGIMNRDVFSNNQWYQFKGWTGSGQGAYSSPDTTGNDTSATVTMNNVIIETANWRTPPIGIKSIGTEIPKEFMLYQNFPNPFNPVTNINFDLPKNSGVKIVIYDLLGREVQTLVNQQLDAGRYSVDFDASNFASGIYFYRIEAGDYVNIKKMLVVK